MKSERGRSEESKARQGNGNKTSARVNKRKRKRRMRTETDSRANKKKRRKKRRTGAVGTGRRVNRHTIWHEHRGHKYDRDGTARPGAAGEEARADAPPTPRLAARKPSSAHSSLHAAAIRPAHARPSATARTANAQRNPSSTFDAKSATEKCIIAKSPGWSFSFLSPTRNYPASTKLMS